MKKIKVILYINIAVIIAILIFLTYKFIKFQNNNSVSNSCNITYNCVSKNKSYNCKYISRDNKINSIKCNNPLDYQKNELDSDYMEIFKKYNLNYEIVKPNFGKIVSLNYSENLENLTHDFTLSKEDDFITSWIYYEEEINDNIILELKQEYLERLFDYTKSISMDNNNYAKIVYKNENGIIKYSDLNVSINSIDNINKVTLLDNTVSYSWEFMYKNLAVNVLVQGMEEESKIFKVSFTTDNNITIMSN